MNSLKRTQTNPILSAFADKIAPLFRMSFILRGPVRRSFSEDGSVAERPVQIAQLASAEHSEDGTKPILPNRYIAAPPSITPFISARYVRFPAISLIFTLLFDTIIF
jgi:hypothetical protein